jgi:hypothetical protein
VVQANQQKASARPKYHASCTNVTGIRSERMNVESDYLQASADVRVSDLVKCSKLTAETMESIELQFLLRDMLDNDPTVSEK